MRISITFVLLLFLLSAEPTSVKGVVKLPKDMKRQIDRQFPHWRFAAPHKIIEASYQKRIFPNHLSLLTGDFDGNGRGDYALYIYYGDYSARKLCVLAVLQKNNGSKIHILREIPVDADPVADESYLLLAPKGSKEFDHETHKNFTLSRDAITFVILQKAAETFIYHDGNFRRIVTGD